MRSLILLILLCTGLSFTHAQITRSSMLWSGGLRLESQTGPGILGFTLSPETHYFLSDRFTLGGRFSLGSTFEKGVQLLILDPQVRFYFNPEHPQHNIFAFVHSEFFFPIDEELGQENHTRLFAGGGWQARLNPNVTLETKLSAIYNDQALMSANESFFARPAFQLETGLLFFLNAYEDTPVRPAIGRGSWMIGGSNLQAGYRSNDFSRQFNIGITPRVGYFITDNWLAGAGFPFSHSEFRTRSNFSGVFLDKVSTNITGIAPFLRYYTGLLGTQVHPYFEAQATFLRIRQHQFDPFNELPPRSTQVQFSGGIDYFLTPSAALEASAFLLLDRDNDTTRLGLQLGFQFFLVRADRSVDDLY